MPGKKELLLALEIAHNIIENVYDLPTKVEKIKEARSKRRK